MSKSAVFKHKAFPVTALFFCFAVIFHTSYSTSRIMAMAAMTEDRSFAVNHYITPFEWSNDWARTPNGSYYSNKAPGPVLLGYPVYWAIDKIFNHDQTRELRDQFRYRYLQIYMWIIALIFQLIPLALLAIWLFRFLPEKGLSYWETQTVVAVLLFGNTAAFYMANLGGHGITALFAVGLGLSIYFKYPFLAGMFFGWGLLSDYGSAMLLLPALIGLMMASGKKIQALVKFGLGGLLPGALWIFYHQVSFGNPFRIANEFQNPIYLDMATQKNNIWGILVPLPRWEPMWELIVGDRRGLLKTQPWVLFFIVWFFTHLKVYREQTRELRALTVFALSGLFLLYYMNCCFGGWDGGPGPGPRYMSAIFPVFAIMIALWVPSMSTNWRKAHAWAALLPLVFFVYYSSFRVGIFGNYFNFAFSRLSWGKAVTMLLGLALYLITFYYIKKNQTTADLNQKRV